MTLEYIMTDDVWFELYICELRLVTRRWRPSSWSAPSGMTVMKSRSVIACRVSPHCLAVHAPYLHTSCQ